MLFDEIIPRGRSIISAISISKLSIRRYVPTRMIRHLNHEQEDENVNTEFFAKVFSMTDLNTLETLRSELVIEASHPDITVLSK